MHKGLCIIPRAPSMGDDVASIGASSSRPKKEIDVYIYIYIYYFPPYLLWCTITEHIMIWNSYHRGCQPRHHGQYGRSWLHRDWYDRRAEGWTQREAFRIRASRSPRHGRRDRRRGSLPMSKVTNHVQMFCHVFLLYLYFLYTYLIICIYKCIFVCGDWSKWIILYIYIYIY